MSNILARLADYRNEAVAYLVAIGAGINLLIDVLAGADLSTLDGVQAGVLAVAALIARANVWSRASVEEIRARHR